MLTGTEIEAAGISAEARDVIAIVVVAIIYVALFCWLAVVGWAKHRRLERESYYRSEIEKKLLDTGDAGGRQILRMRVEEESTRWLKRREGFKVSGLVITALGIGILVGLQVIDIGDLSLAGAGWIPLIIGAALVLYAYMLYPKYTFLDIESSSPTSDESRNDQAG